MRQIFLTGSEISVPSTGHEPRCELKAAFVVPEFGDHVPVTLPFGLTGAPASYQRLIEQILPIAKGGDLNGVLDEKLNLGETHLLWCSLFRKYQRCFSPEKKTPQTEKDEF